VEENVGRFDRSWSNFRNGSGFVRSLVERRSRCIGVRRIEVGLLGELRVLEIYVNSRND